MIQLVVARAANGVIGRDGKLPWHIPADLKRFKALTMGAPMIMGRKTFESLPGLLPGRRHIVLTRDAEWRVDGVEVASTPAAALALASADRISIIGGAEVFSAFEPFADAVELTEIRAKVDGDTVMPGFAAPTWHEVSREDHAAADGQPPYSFVRLERASPSRAGWHDGNAQPIARAMERLPGGSPVPAHLRGGVVALGNFDGFHRGHQAVVGRAVELARAQRRPALVATFDPHPARFFAPDAPPFRLTSLAQRERLFAAAGADAMLVFRFDAELAAVTAEDFVADWLIGRVGAAGVVTGEDFTFGKRRGGDVEVLARLGAAHGLAAEAVAPVADGAPISSSRIRAALVAGEPEEAARLLTRPFAIEGVVEHGDKVGRTIGYPTANLTLGTYLRPRFGIYAVRGRLADGRRLDGAANIGIRPTFDPPKELLEPFFFDFAGDLYGQRVEVELISFLRDEARFDGLDALTAQMDADCTEARRRLSLLP